MATPAYRVRIAPSPTGDAHVGHARTALYDYILVKQNAGTFILRIDDTDTARNTANSEAGVIRGLQWLGLDWDEGPDKGGEHGPYRQSERLSTYHHYAQQLLTEGKAYECFCSQEELEVMRMAQQEAKEDPKYNGQCRLLSAEQKNTLASSGRVPTVRLLVTGGIVGFDDLVRGWIETDTSLMGDFIILKSNGIPVYNFATVIDDHLMEISHVTRAAEHIINTIPQVLIYQALGWSMPKFAHFSTMLNEDRTKMSKRKGATFIGQYADMGYLPEAMLNFLAFLGWSPGDSGDEIMTLDEMIAKFSLDKCTVSNAIFDAKKLDWINAKWIRRLSPLDLAVRMLPFLQRAGLTDNEVDINWLSRLAVLVQERMTRLDEAPVISALFFVEPDLPYQEIRQTLAEAEGKSILMSILDTLLATTWNEVEIEKALRGLQPSLGISMKTYFMTLRLATTGSTVSPPLFASLAVLGKERVIARLTRTISNI
ncbi:MAG: glutamate--tRNA ligase [Firmicutes bacterium]|nr:glutamate--tRNA ligase [Dethiobacter sp.]MBS3888020.1 glutamate--tRNA ligase [Bacillota bacterium]MBS4055398.1 glutamate--tRNA ligase [Thermaerobacter sp.]